MSALARTGFAATPSQRLWLRVAVYLGTFMALLDVSIVNVALSDIQKGLGTGISGLQWVVDAYALCLSSLMLSAGALGDRYGRKLIWMSGAILFTIGSAVCAFAPDMGWLIAGRALQGMGASTLTPGGLSLLVQGWPDPTERARVIGAWSAFAAFSLVVGPIIGGVLVDYAGWPSIFLINLPIGVLAVAVGVFKVGESADPEHAALDPVGQGLSVLWLLGLSYGLIVGGAQGWGRADALGALALALVGLAAFLIHESRTARPMLPLAMFAGRNFTLISLAAFVMGFSGYASFFFLALYLQQVQGYSASMTGFAYLPLCGVQTALSLMTGNVVARFGPRWPMILGYALIGLGIMALALLPDGVGYPVIAVAFVVLGVGMGIAMPSSTAAGLMGVARERSGMASAIINCGRQTGNTVGIALLGAVLTSYAVAGLSGELGKLDARLGADAARDLLASHGAAMPAGVDAVAVHGLFVVHFADGFRLAMVVAGMVALATAAALWIGKAGVRHGRG